MIKFNLQISGKYLQSSFKTEIDFNEVKILELTENLAIFEPLINAIIYHSFT